jgi:hypothetical protein
VLACNAILGIRSYSGADAGHAADDASDDFGSFDEGVDFDGGSDAHHSDASGPPDGLAPPTGDAAKAAQAYPNDVIQAYCAKLKSCCDAGFDQDVCAKELGNNVGNTYLGLILNGIASTHYAYNAAHAATCIHDFTLISCTNNGTATLKTLLSACSSAYTGLLGKGATGCQSSFDCEPGLYCGPVDSSGDTVGGAGTCVALAGVGKNCVDTTYSSDCTYLGLGNEDAGALFCAPSGSVGSGGKCTMAQQNGTSCETPGVPQQCLSQFCVAVEGGFSCEDNGPLTVNQGTNLCTMYVDGGA